MTVTNPILTGFYPDPSLLRVGEDYYIANSTFEWFGGVEIHHSRNLADWDFVTRPLSTLRHLDLRGNPASGGIWAPCLSYAHGRFWLLFTDVKTWNEGPFKDCHNYVTTATDIRGPWSEPVYLNSSGFDPSLFHDEDGRTWLVNMEWDYRKPQPASFTGILLQQLDVERRTLVGPIRKIFTGTSIGLTEGPHLVKRQGWYYLLTAEGGTEYGHAVTVARSRTLEGPYEVHPANPLVTSRGDRSLVLQKAGHGSLCDTPDGRWFLAFLVGRPLPGRDECVLGRETALAEVEWDDGWPRLRGGNRPPTTVVIEPPLAPATPRDRRSSRSTFESAQAVEAFLQDFLTLRAPFDPTVYSTTDRPGWLRIRGRESLVSRHHQSLIARRQSDFSFEATTHVEFEPDSFQQMAGLIYRYDEANQYYLRISGDGPGNRRLGILILDQRVLTIAPEGEVPLAAGAVELRLTVDFSRAQFSWRQGARAWQDIGPELDAGKLSDEYGGLGFTGAFVGLACQDLAGQRQYADFQSFTYTRRSP